MLQGYKTSCYQISRILAAWKCDFCRFVKSTFQGTSQRWGNFIKFWVSKMRFCRVVKSTIKGYQASCEQIFHVLVVWNFDFCRFVKSTFQGYQAACQVIWRMYQASCVEIFCILAVSKYYCCRFVKLTFQGNSQRVGIFFMFEAWKCDFAQSWNQRFKGTKYVGAIFPQVPSFVWTKYPHFVCLKMRFLPIRETNVSWYLAKRGIF